MGRAGPADTFFTDKGGNVIGVSGVASGSFTNEYSNIRKGFFTPHLQ
jgi:hypothetical protein